MSDQSTSRAHPLLGVYGLSYSWRNQPQPESSGERKFGRGPTDRGSSGLVQVLNQVSFELARGEIIALFGPNGSGKSTLMKAAAGLLPLGRPGCGGQVRCAGIDFLSLSTQRRAQKIAYIGADLRAEFPLTAEEAVSLGRTCSGSGLFHPATRKDRERVQWAMEQTYCSDFRKRRLDRLSGGERQLVAMARALAQGAQVLFLDETLSRMDLNHQAAIGSRLKGLAQQGFGILVVSHDLNLATEWSDSVLLLKDGKKLAQGPLREVLTQENIGQLYPDADLVMGKNPKTGAPKVFFSVSG